MKALLLIVPVTLCIAALFGWLFIRAVADGQYDDMDDPAVRILRD